VNTATPYAERVFDLGAALACLEAAERGGAAICLHSSWCAAPGEGFWIVLVRPAGWSGAPLGKPVVGWDLVDVLERACGLCSTENGKETPVCRNREERDVPLPRGDLVPVDHVRELEREVKAKASAPIDRLARSLRRRPSGGQPHATCEVCLDHVDALYDGACEECAGMIERARSEVRAARRRLKAKGVTESRRSSA
jgi:hypothetical protein